MDEQTAHNRATYDAIATAYDARLPQHSGVSMHLLDRLCDRLPAGALVADLGCGPGRDLKTLQDGGFRVVGVDLSAGMLTYAASRAPGRVVAADLRALPIGDATVDGVWSSYALLHLDADGLIRAVTEVSRVLRPGGVAALVLASGEGAVLEPVGYAPEHDRWFHLHRLENVTAACWAAGLTVLDADMVPEASRSPVRLLARR